MNNLAKNVLKDSVRGIELIPLDDALFNKRQIFLEGEVTADSCNALIKQLLYLQSVDDKQEITLFINSNGGSVFDGLALYDFIRLIDCDVNTCVIGTAASMGAILALAGKKRMMLPSSRWMIHDPSYSSFNVGGKKSHEIQEEVNKLNEVREASGKIIAEKTGKSMEEIYEVTAKDTYFNADEALKFGLCTEIISNDYFDLSNIV